MSPRARRLVRFLFRRRTLFLDVTPIVLILLAQPNPMIFWIGVPFVIGGEAIRIWSAGYLIKAKRLVTGGPFGFCRNPIYIGSFLTAVGYFTMSGRVEIWIAGIVLFWLFHGGAIVYEERLLRRIYKEEFEQYCKATPRLFPRRRVSNGEWAFSFRQVLANNEHRTALGTALLTSLFAMMAYYPQLAPARWLVR